MNPLTTAEVCMLYDRNCSFLETIKYSRSHSSITLIFPSKPNYEIPKEIFLMPGEIQDDYTSFLCTTTGIFTEYYVEQTNKTWYLMECETFDLPEYQSELRINVSFAMNVVPQDISTNILIMVKDISVGGLKFISDTKFDTDKTFSFIFTKGHSPVLINAHIVKQRPTRKTDVYCYSCQFLGLNPKSESALRGYIFKEDLIQNKSHPS